VRLEALRVGRRWRTSLEAAQRFFAATTPDLSEPAVAPRSAGRRAKAASKAGQQLERMGI
jgi:hypothetical protein